MPDPDRETWRGKFEDWRIADHVGWRFAFRTLAYARRYFGPFALRRLAVDGFVLNVYAVPWEAAHLARVNLRFDPARARLLRTIRPAQLALQMSAELAVLRGLRLLATPSPRMPTEYPQLIWERAA